MSGKVCHHHHHSRCRKYLRRFLISLSIVVFTALILVLITWAILQPKKPSFALQDATIFVLNVSAPNVISTTLQVTVNSRNPNSNIGIYYDRMHAYAIYHDQQITYYTSIPPVYQGHKDVNVWSPFVYGNNVPVAPYNGIALGQDQSDGVISMTLKVDGRLKWRVGSIVTGYYYLHVSCPANIPIGNNGNNNGIVIGSGIKYQLSQSCSVNV